MEVYINDCVRTVRGKAKPNGGLASQTPEVLVRALIDAFEARGRLDPDMVEHLSLGCVGQTGAQGGHIAMVSKITAQLPGSCSAHSINNFCASGLSAIGLAASLVSSGQKRTALAGGVEMLSRVPFMADNADYYTAESFAPQDRYIPVALAADMLAADQNISRDVMDRLALQSQKKASETDQNSALQASRIAVAGLNTDEAIRPASLKKLSVMPSAFPQLAQDYSSALENVQFEHRLTLAHAPPMTDGAGLAVLGGAGCFENPRARIISFAEAGGDSRQSLLAGISAMQAALGRAKMSLDDMDRIEFMEAFATPFAIFERDWQPDMGKVNVSGGHIAKGHPMGATGAILLSTLMDALDVADGRYGLVVVTGAQGVGVAMIIERL